MKTTGTVLTWICAGIVALPLSPCAFLAGAGCPRQAQRADEPAPEPPRTCCADHAQGADQPADEHQPQREAPCSGQCCRLAPFVPTSEKLVAASPADALVASVPHVDESRSSVIAPPTSATPQPLSLNILHCRWRC